MMQQMRKPYVARTASVAFRETISESVTSFGLNLVGRMYAKAGYCRCERETASEETRRLSGEL